jgi:hypothetical protein
MSSSSSPKAPSSSLPLPQPPPLNPKKLKGIWFEEDVFIGPHWIRDDLQLKADIRSKYLWNRCGSLRGVAEGNIRNDEITFLKCRVALPPNHPASFGEEDLFVHNQLNEFDYNVICEGDDYQGWPQPFSEVCDNVDVIEVWSIY